MHLAVLPLIATLNTMRPRASLVARAALLSAASFNACDAFLYTSDTPSANAALVARQENRPAPSALNIAPSQYWDGIDGPWCVESTASLSCH